MVIYKNILPSTGYLTEDGKINFSRLDVLFKDISKLEEELFKLNQEKIARQKAQGGHPGGRNVATRNPNGLGFVSEVDIKKNTREALEKELIRTDIGDNEKNKIA